MLHSNIDLPSPRFIRYGKTYSATVVKVNGNPAALADLKPDMQIHFTLAADNVTATELSASRPPAGS